MSLIKYLQQLGPGKQLLWCYLIWYIAIITFYFDSKTEIWLSAIGISLIVGIALVLSTSCWPVNIRALDRWQTMRLFAIPFCVSSYSSLIQDKGFYLIFPPQIKTSGFALLAITVFLFVVQLLKKISPTKSC